MDMISPSYRIRSCPVAISSPNRPKEVSVSWPVASKRPKSSVVIRPAAVIPVPNSYCSRVSCTGLSGRSNTSFVSVARKSTLPPVITGLVKLVFWMARLLSEALLSMVVPRSENSSTMVAGPFSSKLFAVSLTSIFSRFTILANPGTSTISCRSLIVRGFRVMPPRRNSKV